MKALYGLSLALLALAAGTACSGPSQAQDSKTAIASMIDSRNYVFVAQTVTPLGGRSRQLTSEYDLRVYGDSIVSFLPYFGRAYSAPVDPRQGGIQFTSTNFEYAQSPRRNGGWNITISPKDAQDVREMTLTISQGGNASLQVISNNRQSISFSGRVQSRN